MIFSYFICQFIAIALVVLDCVVLLIVLILDEWCLFIEEREGGNVAL